MILVAQVKLVPSAEQAAALQATLRRMNEACDWISAQAWSERSFRQYDIHRLCYHEARARFGLCAQATVRCIAKVSDAYKLDRKTCRTFRTESSCAFDQRILHWYFTDGTVSIWTIAGRQRIRLVCGEHQVAMLSHCRSQSELCLVRGKFYLAAPCDVAEEPLAEVEKFLGVDLGVANLATTSDGTRYSGDAVEVVRQKYHRTRKSLGHKMSGKRSTRRNARRAMRRIGNREQRFHRHQNHCISKQIVACAKGNGLGIAIEDLKASGILGKSDSTI